MKSLDPIRTTKTEDSNLVISIQINQFSRQKVFWISMSQQQKEEYKAAEYKKEIVAKTLCFRAKLAKISLSNMLSRLYGFTSSNNLKISSFWEGTKKAKERSLITSKMISMASLCNLRQNQRIRVTLKRAISLS